MQHLPAGIESFCVQALLAGQETGDVMDDDSFWIDDASHHMISKEAMNKLEIIEHDDVRDRIRVRSRQVGKQNAGLTQSLGSARGGPISNTYMVGELRHYLARMENQILCWMVRERYTYVGVRVRGAWYTSAQEENTYFQPVMSDAQLADALVLHQATRVGIMRSIDFI